jgi:hypothetical protein
MASTPEGVIFTDTEFKTRNVTRFYNLTVCGEAIRLRCSLDRRWHLLTDHAYTTIYRPTRFQRLHAADRPTDARACRRGADLCR